MAQIPAQFHCLQQSQKGLLGVPKSVNFLRKLLVTFLGALADDAEL
ncbi:hypothetical protein ACP70R_012019 [Stipagrostis hirtigluma subsp. patula]